MKPGTYYRLPKRVGAWLEDGTITPTEFGLIAYLGCADADFGGEGIPMTYGMLQAVFRCSDRTITRSLHRLRDLDAVRYELRQGQRRPFRIRLGPAALVQSDETTDVVPEAVSEHMSDVASPRTALDAALEEAKTSDMTSSDDRRTETETETNTELILGSVASATDRAQAPGRETLTELLRGFDPLRSWLRNALRSVEGADERSVDTFLKSFPEFGLREYEAAMSLMLRARAKGRVRTTEIQLLFAICKSIRLRERPDYDSVEEWDTDGAYIGPPDEDIYDLPEQDAWEDDDDDAELPS